MVYMFVTLLVSHAGSGSGSETKAAQSSWHVLRCQSAGKERALFFNTKTRQHSLAVPPELLQIGEGCLDDRTVSAEVFDSNLEYWTSGRGAAFGEEGDESTERKAGEEPRRASTPPTQRRTGTGPPSDAELLRLRLGGRRASTPPKGEARP